MNKRGFSLVEVVVAAVVFSVAVASVFASVSSFRLPVQKSMNRVRAAQLSKKILEDLRHKVIDPEHADLTIGAHGSAAAPRTDGEFDGYGYWYQVSAAGESKRVDITVRTPP